MNPLAILEIGARLLDKIIPDKDAREKAQFELMKAAQDQEFQMALNQLSINQKEAEHSSVFVAGWRPFIAWACGFGLVYNFIVYPLLLWLVAVYQADITPPPLFSDNLMELILGMLGLGAMRTYEKFRGVERNKI
jgi:hypothetical protein